MQYARAMRGIDSHIAPPYDPILDKPEATTSRVLACLAGLEHTDELGREAYQITEETEVDFQLSGCPEIMAELIALALNYRESAPKAYAQIKRTIGLHTGELYE